MDKKIWTYLSSKNIQGWQISSREAGDMDPQSKKPLQWETHGPQPESGPHSLQLEKAHVTNSKKPVQAKINK